LLHGKAALFPEGGMFSVALSYGLPESPLATIRSVAGASPSEEIAKARALLGSGAISEAEFASIKRSVLA
jgi:hypothetical protein